MGGKPSLIDLKLIQNLKIINQLIYDGVGKLN